MKHARRFAALIAALLLLFACALADTARVYPDADGSFLLLRQDDQTLLIGSGGEAAVRRLAEASGLPGVDRVLVLCDHPTHIESAQRMASLLDIGTETRDAPLRVETESGLYIIGTDKIEANAICYGCDGKALSQTPAATQQYVLNRNTKKFHTPHLLQRETNERKEPAGLRRHARGNHSARIRALQALQAVKS